MLGKVQLGSGPGFVVWEVRCAGQGPAGASGWSAPESSDRHGLVFVRAGLFRRRSRGAEAMLDPAAGYWDRPGDEQQVAHPLQDGDVCTLVTLSDDLVAELAGDDPAVPDGPVLTTAAVDLAHRELAARARRGAGAMELSERVTRLVATVLAQRLPERVASGRPATAGARRRLAAAAREALTAHPEPLALGDLARLVGASPWHLSRVFQAETGESLTGLRNRLRVRAALERIAGGAPDLAGLAADLGFADHAHLTRTLRAQLDRTPTQLRRTLRA